MTDNDKALVERLRDESIVGMPMENEAADRIETLNAMLKAAEESLGDQLAARKEQADRIEAQAAEIERLREALGKLAPMVDWMPHPDCVTAEQIIRAALGETE